MTKTVDSLEKTIIGSFRAALATIDITSYTSGGEVLAASDFGLARIEFVSAAASENVHVVAWDGSKTAPKLVVSDGATEASAAADVGTVEVFVLGK